MNKEKILLVDDELEELSSLVEFLEKKYYVTGVDSAKKALECIEKEDFEAFLLDISMPKMDGLELCRSIKEKEQFADTPVLFLTANSDIEKLEQGFEYGAVDYLLKPFNLYELDSRLNCHIKTSKKLMKEHQEQMKLNDQINTLTKELLEMKNKLLDEETFQQRESNFSYTNKKLVANKDINEKFNEKVLAIQKNLQRQKEILEKTKRLLG